MYIINIEFNAYGNSAFAYKAMKLLKNTAYINNMTGKTITKPYRLTVIK
jgi:hypothetical protein